MIRRIVLAAITTMLSAGVLVPAAAASPPEIQVFQSASAFAGDVRVDESISFDDLRTGASLSNPAALGSIRVLHASAASFKASGDPFVPVSSPNVLAPLRSDGTFDFGVTTLAFDATKTKAAGLYLVLGRGSSGATLWTTTVTATNAKEQRVDVTVTFQGTVGEQRFIGFASRSRLVSISFDVASRTGAVSVLALDDLSMGK